MDAPLKFLIVDDDIALTMMFKKMLTSRGHSVFIEVNASRVQPVIEKERVDIVLIDLVLPGLDGSEIIKKIKSKYPDVYCVLISGYYNEGFVNYTTLVGADLVLPKPITAEIMEDVIRRYHEKQAAGRSINDVLNKGNA